MKRHILSLPFFIFVLVLFSPGVHANETLLRIESQYEKMSSWQVEFVQTSFIESLGQDLVKKGRIAALRPKLLRIDYLTDPQKSYIYNGEKLWIHYKSTNEAEEYRKANRVLSEEALSFLGGFRRITELFAVIHDLNEPDNTLTIRNKSLNRVALLPKNRDSDILRLTLGIDKKSGTIREAVLYNASGNTTHYSFEKPVTNISMNENSFALPEKTKVNLVK